jgi:hypothetical protein
MEKIKTIKGTNLADIKKLLEAKKQKANDKKLIKK